MPLMRPEVQAVLRKAGLVKEETPAQTPLSEKLNLAGISLDQSLENLAEIANGTGNESLKLRANETALKLHGALKEATVSSIPSFTIVFNEPLPSSGPENPILLPRQLLSQLSLEKESTN